ncbi:hypothetical protein F4808DRAFT_418985 [Astrocystis sublimbata]|nr:hypothetical protein F4808DRAFT_418985 [Astrocystis sublimbata]
MGSKQFHSKSRNGCGQCKKRRVRCNRQGPVCSNCHRRDEFCDYLRAHDSQLFETGASVSGAPVAQLEIACSSRPLELSAAMDRVSHFGTCTNLFAALDHYTCSVSEQELLTYTSTSFLNPSWTLFTGSRNGQPASYGDLDSQNSSVEYLLPTVSSLCAIYQSLQRGSWSSDLYVKAIQYNLAASTLFRQAEHDVHEGNWLPILMFGVGHIMFSFAVAQSAQNGNFDYLDVFQVLRGTASIGDQIGMFLEKSELNDILARRRCWATPPSAIDEMLKAIGQLSTAGHPEGTLTATQKSCDHALAKLIWWVRLVNGVPQTWKHFILWPASVMDGFAAALTDKQPVALLIYLYWCAVMNRAPRRWYLDGWHARIAVAVISNLGSDHDRFLQWPRLALDLG